MTKVHEILMVAKQMKTKRRISRDLLYNSLQLAYQINGIVRGITVFPDLTIVLWVIFSQVTLVQNKVLTTRFNLSYFVLGISCCLFAKICRQSVFGT